MKQRAFIALVAVMWVSLTIIPYGIMPATAAQNVEDVLIIPNLETNTFTWRVDKALGIFAADDLHQGNLFEAKVTDADINNLRYTATYSLLTWGNTTYYSTSNVTNSQYLFVKRHWVDVSQNMIIPQCVEYWNEVNLIGSKTHITYGQEFIHGYFIDTVSIACEWNATNWFRAKFSRAEGILLKLDIQVDAPNGVEEGVDIRGNLLINHVSQSYVFSVSLWHYVIWFLVIFGAIMTVIIVLSIIASRRKAAALRLNY